MIKNQTYQMNTGKVDVLLGLQWGDEGKGKVVDVLTPQYDVIARFQGGPNAGHTLEFEGEKYVLRSIPSGIFQGGKVNVIGNGVVLAPDLFMDEARDLERSGHELKTRLHISKKAHLIMPTHRLLDACAWVTSSITLKLNIRLTRLVMRKRCVPWALPTMTSPTWSASGWKASNT